MDDHLLVVGGNALLDSTSSGRPAGGRALLASAKHFDTGRLVARLHGLVGFWCEPIDRFRHGIAVIVICRGETDGVVQLALNALFPALQVVHLALDAKAFPVTLVGVLAGASENLPVVRVGFKFRSDEDLLEDCMVRACAIYAAVVGAQLFARGRSDIAFFDAMIASYRAVGLSPA
ncbi:hypothetical protein [Sphingomonas sp. Leaf10]|uniref:hypothetical protein n=1 Tax=Sphingomonas sp. Leaf10 TaxID=1735676 RepID=UPI0019109E06|nr:hypothetical protein [Sphingomonas sp. Leaf10]